MRLKPRREPYELVARTFDAQLGDVRLEVSAQYGSVSRSHAMAAGTCAGSMWCPASDSWYSTAGRLPRSARGRGGRSATSMIGSLRPWAMNTRVLSRPASSGCQPSTVGTKPEKARIPAGAGRPGPSPSE